MASIRTKKEIEAMIAKGEIFIAKHPYTIFGDNNVKGFEIFKRLAGRILAGENIEKLKKEDSEMDLDSREGEDFHSAVGWLSGEEDELY